MALPFGLCLAPYIFTAIADMVEWILTHNCGVNFLGHYLDDFMTLGPQASPVCHYNLQACIRLCIVNRKPIHSQSKRYNITKSRCHNCWSNSYSSIKLILWENDFTLAENKAYAIKNVTVLTFSNSKYLTTTKHSTVIQIDDMEETAPPTAQQHGKNNWQSSRGPSYTFSDLSIL